MRRYETEVVISADRYVGLQLPSYLPVGRAIVTVQVEEPAQEDEAAVELDLDRDDIEWWDEFGDDAEADEPRVSSRA